MTERTSTECKVDELLKVLYIYLIFLSREWKDLKCSKRLHNINFLLKSEVRAELKKTKNKNHIVLGFTYAFMVVKNILPHNGCFAESWSNIHNAGKEKRRTTGNNMCWMFHLPLLCASLYYLPLHVESLQFGEVRSKSHLLHECPDIRVWFPAEKKNLQFNHFKWCWLLKQTLHHNKRYFRVSLHPLF